MTDIPHDAIDPGFRAARRTDAAIAAVELEGETVVFDEDTGALHLLDATATTVWQCLDGRASLAELSAELAEATGAALDLVQRDVVDLVRTLGRRGLLEGVAADPEEVQAHRVTEQRDA